MFTTRPELVGTYGMVAYGPRGLDLMERGQTAEQTLEALVSADEARDDRQVGVVDGRGGTATLTGSGCFDWAGGVTGEHYAAQGNILVGGEVRSEVADALRRTGYLEGSDVGDDPLFDAISAYIRTENFEEREQRRGNPDRAVLEYMKGQG